MHFCDMEFKKNVYMKDHTENEFCKYYSWGKSGKITRNTDVMFRRNILGTDCFIKCTENRVDNFDRTILNNSNKLKIVQFSVEKFGRRINVNGSINRGLQCSSILTSGMRRGLVSREGYCKRILIHSSAEILITATNQDIEDEKVVAIFFQMN